MRDVVTGPLIDCVGTRAQSVSAGRGRECLCCHRVIPESGGVCLCVHQTLSLLLCRLCLVHCLFSQNKLSDLDSRLSLIGEEEKSLGERLTVLRANADKLNPKNKKATSETLR